MEITGYQTHLKFLMAVCGLALQVKFQQSLRHGTKLHYRQFCLSDFYWVLKIGVEKKSWEKLAEMTVFQLRNIGGGIGELREPPFPSGILGLTQQSLDGERELNETPPRQSLPAHSIENLSWFSEARGKGRRVKRDFLRWRAGLASQENSSVTEIVGSSV